jgi:hypothetical protein
MLVGDSARGGRQLPRRVHGSVDQRVQRLELIAETLIILDKHTPQRRGARARDLVAVE